MQSMSEQDDEAIRDALVSGREFEFIGTTEAAFKRLRHAAREAGKVIMGEYKEALMKLSKE